MARWSRNDRYRAGAGLALFLAGAAALPAAQAAAARPRPPAPSRAAAQLYLASRHALAARHVVDVEGTVRSGQGRLHLVVRSSSKGHAAQGTFWSTSKTANGFVGAYSFVRIGSHVYLKANATFWASSASVPVSVVERLRSRWIALPASYGNRIATDTGRMTNPVRLAAGFLAARAAAGATFEAPRTIAGHPTRPIRLAHGTLYVRRPGTPLPVVIVGSSAATSWTIRFSYPRSNRIAAPPGAKTLSQVERGPS